MTQETLDLLWIAPPGTAGEAIDAALRAHAGLAVHACPSLEAAAELLARRPIDAALLPAGALAEGARRLRALAPLLPVIGLAPDQDAGLAALAPLVAAQEVTVLAAAEVRSPFFGALLRRLVGRDREQAQRESLLHLLEGERRARDLERALREVSKSLVATLEPEQVLDRLLEALLRLFQCDAANIMLVEEDAPGEAAAWICRWRGFGPFDLHDQVQGRRFDLATTPNLLDAVEHRDPLLIPDARSYPGWVSYPDTRWIRAHICAPIFLEEALVGFLNVDSATPGAFGAGDGEMLAALVPLAAVALRNARLFEDERRARAAALRQVENLEALNAIALQTSTEQNPGAIGRIVVEAIVGLTHSDGVAYFRHEPAGDRLVQVESAGSARPFQGQVLPPETWASVKDRGQPLLVEDYATWEGRVDYPIADSVHALAVVPVAWQEHQAGVLAAFRQDSPAPYTPSEVHLLQLLTRQMAVAVYSAELYQSLRRERDRLLALSTIDQQILDIFDNPRAALSLILRYALDLLRLPKGLIVLSAGADDVLLYTEGVGDVARARALLLAHWERERRTHEQRGPQSYAAFERVPPEHETFAAWAAEEGVGGTLTIPLWIQGEVAGVLSLMDGQAHAWQPEEIKVAQMLAGQASIAMEKALLAQRLRRRLEEAEMLNRLLQAVNATLALDKILDALCRHVRRALDVPCVTAGILQNSYLVIVSENRAANVPSSKGDIVPLSQAPLLRRALEERGAIALPEIAPAEARDSLYLRPGWTRSLFLLPLVIRDNAVGIVLAESPEPRAFTAQERELVNLIIAVVTPALENAQLFQEVQEARQRSEEALERLQRLDAMKTQFIQNVSHELRTPLTIIKGYIDMMLDQSLGFEMAPMLRQAMQGIHTHTYQLVKMVESITALEDAELGRIELTPQPMLPILLTAVQTIWQRAMRYELEIILDLPDYLPKVDLDTQQMIRALNHLLDNAIKFNRKRGKIWVRAWQKSFTIWVQVQDSGIGIPKEELECIFDRFYQVDGTASRQYSGMGLGLSVVRQIIQAHEGHVWAESEGEGQGATFTVTLPVYQPEERA